MTIAAEMLERGRRARAAADLIRLAPPETRTHALEAAAVALRAHADRILAANAEDIERARANGLSEALIEQATGF